MSGNVQSIAKVVGLTRIDIAKSNTHGWMMRICRQGDQYREFFSDKRCGGSEAAKKEASERYAELNLRLPPPSKTREIASSRNRSGVVGVHVAVSLDSRKLPYKSYCASWVDEVGRRKKVTFSWKKFGKSAAWRLAVIARTFQIVSKAKIVAIDESNRAGRSSPRVRKPR